MGPAYGAQSMFYFKPPTARGQALHQDNLLLQAHPETCLAAWIAVDECDGENGGLIALPGSHRIQILCPDEDADPEESFTDKTIRVPDVVERIRAEFSERIAVASPLAQMSDSHHASVTRMRLAAVRAERDELIRLWQEGAISDEVLHHIEEELDYEESRL